MELGTGRVELGERVGNKELWERAGGRGWTTGLEKNRAPGHGRV